MTLYIDRLQQYDMFSCEELYHVLFVSIASINPTRWKTCNFFLYSL